MEKTESKRYSPIRNYEEVSYANTVERKTVLLERRRNYIFEKNIRANDTGRKNRPTFFAD